MANELERTELKGVLVLVVDDDEDNREMLATVLEHSGAVVATAQSAAEALWLIEREPFDVLVSDIGLPNEDGFTLLRKVRTLSGRRGSLPAIALTGFAGDEDRRRAGAVGFQALLPKPIALNDMLATLLRVLPPSRPGPSAP